MWMCCTTIGETGSSKRNVGPSLEREEVTKVREGENRGENRSKKIGDEEETKETDVVSSPSSLFGF